MGEDEDPDLARAHVMTFRKYGTQGRINKMEFHAANHAFAKAFLLKHFPRSERVRQNNKEAHQLAGAADGGALALAAATVQRNAELRDNPEQQAASLGGSGLTNDDANAPPVVSGYFTNKTAPSSAVVTTHTPNAQSVQSGLLALVDRLVDGPERNALVARQAEHEMHMLQRHAEHEMKMRERQVEMEEARKDAEFKAEQAHKDVAHQAVMAEYRANEERRVVAHDAAMTESVDRRLQSRQLHEAELSRRTRERQEDLMATIRTRLDACTNEDERTFWQGAHALVTRASTEFKFAINPAAPEAPVPLTQAILAAGSGSLAELHLPTRFDVLLALTDNFVTLQTLLQTCYPSVKLTDAQKKELGKLVANKYDSENTGRPVRTHTTVSGTTYAPRSYPFLALMMPPLKELIERFVKNPPAPKRKASAPPAGEGHTTRRATLYDFVTVNATATP